MRNRANLVKGGISVIGRVEMPLLVLQNYTMLYPLSYRAAFFIGALFMVYFYFYQSRRSRFSQPVVTRSENYLRIKRQDKTFAISPVKTLSSW